MLCPIRTVALTRDGSMYPSRTRSRAAWLRPASSLCGLVVAPSVIHFDAWVMLAAAFACLPAFITGRYIARWEGAVFLGYYVAYTAYLIMAAQQHDALAAFSSIMMTFALPLTIVTLVVVMIRPRARRAS